MLKGRSSRKTSRIKTHVPLQTISSAQGRRLASPLWATPKKISNLAITASGEGPSINLFKQKQRKKNIEEETHVPLPNDLFHPRSQASQATMGDPKNSQQHRNDSSRRTSPSPSLPPSLPSSYPGANHFFCPRPKASEATMGDPKNSQQHSNHRLRRMARHQFIQILDIFIS